MFLCAFLTWMPVKAGRLIRDSRLFDLWQCREKMLESMRLHRQQGISWERMMSENNNRRSARLTVLKVRSLNGIG